MHMYVCIHIEREREIYIHIYIYRSEVLHNLVGDVLEAVPDLLRASAALSVLGATTAIAVMVLFDIIVFKISESRVREKCSK